LTKFLVAGQKLFTFFQQGGQQGHGLQPNQQRFVGQTGGQTVRVLVNGGRVPDTQIGHDNHDIISDEFDTNYLFYNTNIM